jgi:hypothetical protein
MTRAVPSTSASFSSHVAKLREKRIVVRPFASLSSSSWYDCTSSTTGTSFSGAKRSLNDLLPSALIQPITMSEPFMPPVGDRPKPTQPVAFTTTFSSSVVFVMPQCNVYLPIISSTSEWYVWAATKPSSVSKIILSNNKVFFSVTRREPILERVSKFCELLQKAESFETQKNRTVDCCPLFVKTYEKGNDFDEKVTHKSAHSFDLASEKCQRASDADLRVGLVTVWSPACSSKHTERGRMSGVRCLFARGKVGVCVTSLLMRMRRNVATRGTRNGHFSVSVAHDASRACARADARRAARWDDSVWAVVTVQFDGRGRVSWARLT